MMLEVLARRGARAADKGAARARVRIAARLRDVVPESDIQAETVMLSGRRLALRYDASPDLRWRIAEAIDER